MRSLTVFAAVLSLLMSIPAAQADIKYVVINVRAGDVLNMRELPDPRAPVVSVIPHNGTGIGVTGQAGPGDWVQITHQRKRGWVNARFLGFGTSIGGALPALLQCSGTEPFWSVNLKPGAAFADLMFAQRRFAFRLTRAQTALGRPDVWTIRASSNAGEMTLITKREVCSDGMSDMRYPFSAYVLISGIETITGCCRPSALR